MSCEKLYLTAPEMLECTARVVSCTPNKNDGYDLETDRTPFFSEGGGQLSDIGTLYVEKIREYLSGTDGKDGKS